MKVVSAASVAGSGQGGGELKVLLSGANAGVKHGILGLARVAPGARLPATGYSCHACEEFSYMIVGKVRVWVEGEEAVLGPGDALIIYPGERHYVINEAEETAETVWVLAPPIPLD